MRTDRSIEVARVVHIIDRSPVVTLVTMGLLATEGTASNADECHSLCQGFAFEFTALCLLAQVAWRRLFAGCVVWRMLIVAHVVLRGLFTARVVWRGLVAVLWLVLEILVLVLVAFGLLEIVAMTFGIGTGVVGALVAVHGAASVIVVLGIVVRANTVLSVVVLVFDLIFIAVVASAIVVKIVLVTVLAVVLAVVAANAGDFVIL